MAEKEKETPKSWKSAKLPDGRTIHVSVEGKKKDDDTQDTNPKGGC